jgi:hypothetical protein
MAMVSFTPRPIYPEEILPGTHRTCPKGNIMKCWEKFSHTKNYKRRTAKSYEQLATNNKRNSQQLDET